MRSFIFVVPILLLIASVIFGVANVPVAICKEQSRVVSIDSLEYRSATITVANGRQIIVYEATLKPGDEYCTEWGQ